MPALDVAEHEKEYVVHAELPGIKPEDVEISVLDNVLTISGEKKEEAETAGRSWQHVERRYGAFRRSIQLPAGVEPEKVSVDYRDGVLRITLPKSEKAMPRRITVKAAKG
ncbi:MAG: Hsp20/alpha crystallin family protein [Planctomycetota bacterium]|nr:Hsp20/alpha crystallin family protein [Planctomycetota bacterium]